MPIDTGDTAGLVVNVELFVINDWPSSGTHQKKVILHPHLMDHIEDSDSIAHYKWYTKMSAMILLLQNR